MKKSSLILLGYGLGYILISFLTAFKYVSLTSKDLLPLSIASLLFALAEFCDSGGKLFILTIQQIIFRIFASMSYKRFNKFKKYVEKKYLKKPNEFLFNLNLYYYWSAKCVANHFSTRIQKQYEKIKKTSIITQLFYISAPVALVVLLTIVPHNAIQTSDAFDNAIAMFPLGLMFINVFFDSEFSNISTSFFKSLHTETEKLKKATDEYKEMFTLKTHNNEPINIPDTYKS